MKKIILALFLGIVSANTSIVAMETDEKPVKSSRQLKNANNNSPKVSPQVSEKEPQHLEKPWRRLEKNEIIIIDETLPLLPSDGNYNKYMVLSPQQRDSIEKRAALLEKWESITFRDYTIEDKRRTDWETLDNEMQKKDYKRCERFFKVYQSRFIPGNGKKVKMSGDLIIAILDRPNKTFHKDGHYFQLTPITMTYPLMTCDDVWMKVDGNGWKFEKSKILALPTPISTKTVTNPTDGREYPFIVSDKSEYLICRIEKIEDEKK